MTQISNNGKYMYLCRLTNFLNAGVDSKEISLPHEVIMNWDLFEFCRLQRMTILVMEGCLVCKGEAVDHLYSALNKTRYKRIVIVMKQANG